MIGIEASRRGEVVDADTVFNQLQAKLKLAREQAGACKRDLSESTTILQKAITKH